MKVYYVNSDNLEKLRRNINENIDQYKNGKLKFVQASDLIASPNIKVEDLGFNMSENKPSNSDYENIKIFYSAFKNLTDSQASEERLWVGLCHHSSFSEYLKYRWNCQTETEVISRYFFGPDRPLTTNGLRIKTSQNFMLKI